MQYFSNNNSKKYETQEEKMIDFYSLILYSFNYQIRFNKKMKYNTSFGQNRSSYNENIKKNIQNFIDRLNRKNIEIQNKSFVDFPFQDLRKEDFVYCDSPYLITTGSYNDGNRGIKEWTIEEEKNY